MALSGILTLSRLTNSWVAACAWAEVTASAGGGQLSCSTMRRTKYHPATSTTISTVRVAAMNRRTRLRHRRERNDRCETGWLSIGCIENVLPLFANDFGDL